MNQYGIKRGLNTFVDFGANIGMLLLWYKAFNPDMHSYAFEPDVDNYRLLKKNVKVNKFKNCHLSKSAISNKNGKVKFYQILDPIQNLDSGLSLNQELEYRTFSVPVEKASEVIKKIGKISLLKVDIEGEEYKVFEDIIKNKSLDKISEIIFETHVFNKADASQHKELVVKLGLRGSIDTYLNSPVSYLCRWEAKR